MDRHSFEIPAVGPVTFGRAPLHELGQVEARAAVLGVPWDWGVGYRPGARFGPRAVREASLRFPLGGADRLGGYWDVEAGTRRLDGVALADVGDVDVAPGDAKRTFDRVTGAVEMLLSRGALPVVIGGDNSVSYPVVRAFREGGQLDLIHFDAHLDYTDEVGGLRLTSSSPIKRISELDFVGRIVQIGLRGIRARESAHRDSLGRGNLILTMADLEGLHAEQVLDLLPPLGRCYVQIDVDVLDPAAAPGVSSPEPGGLSYRQLRALLLGLAHRVTIAGFDIVEVNPLVDPSGLTASAAAQLALELLGGTFGKYLPG